MLGDPRVRRLLASDVISGSADSMYWLALIVVLAAQPGGSSWVAAAIVARLTPRLLFGMIGGAAADRYDRRRLLMTLDASRAALMAVLTIVVATTGSPLAAVGIVFAVGVLGTPYRPTVSSVLPELVDERSLGPTNAVWSAVGQLINLLGPVAGLALLAIGPTWLAFALNSASFVLSVVLVFGTGDLGRAVPRDGAPGGPLSGLGAGLAAVRSDSGLLAITAIVAGAMLLRGFELVLHVHVAADRLGLGTAGYGWISAAIAVGALFATPVVARAGLPRHPGRLLLGTSLVGCVSLGLLAAIDQPWIAVVVVAAEGVGIVAFEVAAITLIQLVTPSGLLGRVTGIQSAASGAAKLVGALLAPLFLRAFGLEITLVVVSILVAAAMLSTASRLLALAPIAGATAARIDPILSQLASIAVFDGVPRTALQGLALAARSETVRPGTVVVREGDPADDFFVVVSGELSVSNDDVEINRLGAADWFGEIGLIHRAARTATVQADTDCVLWRFPGADFLATVNTTGTLPDPLVTGMSERLARTDRIRSGGRPAAAGAA